MRAISSLLQKYCPFQGIPTVFLFESRNLNAANLFHNELRLTQKLSFNCPLFWRHQATFFKPLNLTSSSSAEDYTGLGIYRRIDRNPGYFQFEPTASFRDPQLEEDTLQFVFTVPELMVRFETPIVHKVLIFWVKFVSLYVVFHLLCGKVKDVAYGRYFIRAWEVIPWKKLY